MRGCDSEFYLCPPPPPPPPPSLSLSMKLLQLWVKKGLYLTALPVIIYQRIANKILRLFQYTVYTLQFKYILDSRKW